MSEWSGIVIAGWQLLPGSDDDVTETLSHEGGQVEIDLRGSAQDVGLAASLRWRVELQGSGIRPPALAHLRAGGIVAYDSGEELLEPIAGLTTHPAVPGSLRYIGADGRPCPQAQAVWMAYRLRLATAMVDVNRQVGSQRSQAAVTWQLVLREVKSA